MSRGQRAGVPLYYGCSGMQWETFERDGIPADGDMWHDDSGRQITVRGILLSREQGFWSDPAMFPVVVTITVPLDESELAGRRVSPFPRGAEVYDLPTEMVNAAPRECIRGSAKEGGTV